MYHLVGRVGFLNIRLFLDTVEVLLQTIKEEQEKLLRVLLPVPRKIHTVLADSSFELSGRKRTVGAVD